MKESYGNLEKLRKLGINKSKTYTTEQMLDGDLKNENGESRKEVEERMNIALDNIFIKNIGKRIAIVSHGAALSFLLMKWCKLDDNNKLRFKDEMVELTSPCVIKLKFRDRELIELKKIF